jgi:molybdopterin-guanine dinucleotide biosynthesis protein A
MSKWRCIAVGCDHGYVTPGDCPICPVERLSRLADAVEEANESMQQMIEVMKQFTKSMLVQMERQQAPAFPHIISVGAGEMSDTLARAITEVQK